MATGHGLDQFVPFHIDGGNVENNGRMASERRVLDLLEKGKVDSFPVMLERVTAALKEGFPHYTGVYMYLLEGDMLVLGPFRGRPTEHTHIPIGMGVCGRAARIKDTVTVDDVNADNEYLACSLETRSEIVVPIMQGDRVLGEIDIDSDIPAAFTESDRNFLERVAQHLANLSPLSG